MTDSTPTAITWADEVQVWLVNLDWVINAQLPLSAYLSQDELTRAYRFYLPLHQQRFIAARGILRRLLSHYLAIAPDQIQFAYEANGKPKLARIPTHQALQFNLSHSQGWALYGFTCDRPIGVDLEQTRAVADVEALAKRFFTPQEYATLQQQPSDQCHLTFFRYWTCKEAYLKATGDGLKGLQQVEIAWAEAPSGASSPRLRILPHPISDATWTLRELVPVAGYAGAIACPGLIHPLTVMDWPQTQTWLGSM